MNNKYLLFSGNNKMADLILNNYTLMSLLKRFDIKLGFGEKSISDICNKYSIDEHFFVLLCNIHTYDNYNPRIQDIKDIDLKSMLDYLKKSHNYYINNRIYIIEKKLSEMSECCPDNHHKIILRFFEEYKQEILKHFEYEESFVFPNILTLASGNSSEFHINQYEENHDNIDDKLSDLKNILIKYLPDNCCNDDRNDILNDIFIFEEDLSKHTRIEDKVLIPYVKKIQSEYEKK